MRRGQVRTQIGNHHRIAAKRRLGGIVGSSVVHHLIERGWDNIVGIDKSAVPTDIGSTAHASDFCFNTMHDQMTIFTTKYSIDFYEKIGRAHV